MAEWLYEAGIGENRAILVDGEHIIEARIEWPGLRVGTITQARLIQILVPGKRGVATLASHEEVLVEPLGKTTQGGMIRVEITREAISEPGALKRPKGRPSDLQCREGQSLADQIGPHRTLNVQAPDEFENAGWTELVEQASLGIIPFEGGTLRISLTPAMTLIDIDGTLPEFELARAGAKAAAQVIRRFGISGNIGIDLPTVSGKTNRATIDAIFENELPLPFERTAMNGFGFVQIIRPRQRASLCEVMQNDQVGAAARALLRRVQRAAIAGSVEIRAKAAVTNYITAHPCWINEITRQNGGPVNLIADDSLATTGSFHRIS